MRWCLLAVNNRRTQWRSKDSDRFRMGGEDETPAILFARIQPTSNCLWTGQIRSEFDGVGQSFQRKAEGREREREGGRGGRDWGEGSPRWSYYLALLLFPHVGLRKKTMTSLRFLLPFFPFDLRKKFWFFFGFRRFGDIDRASKWLGWSLLRDGRERRPEREGDLAGCRSPIDFDELPTSSGRLLFLAYNSDRTSS